jgi:hypothetical protein
VTEEPVKVIDFRKVEDKCGMSKTDAFQIYVAQLARPGVTYEVIMRDADTWLAIQELAREMGFEVLDAGRREEEGVYYVRIRLAV